MAQYTITIPNQYVQVLLDGFEEHEPRPDGVSRADHARGCLHRWLKEIYWRGKLPPFSTQVSQIMQDASEEAEQETNEFEVA